jgi:hypothetical protein
VHDDDGIVAVRRGLSEQRSEALACKAVRQVQHEGLAVQEAREARKGLAKCLAGGLLDPVELEGPWAHVEGVAGVARQVVADHYHHLAHPGGAEPVQGVPE